jgi:hypothetical protein
MQALGPAWHRNDLVIDRGERVLVVNDQGSIDEEQRVSSSDLIDPSVGCLKAAGPPRVHDRAGLVESDET